MRIRLNGEPREIQGESSVTELILSLGLRPEEVAVELNKKLVARTARSQTVLREGDELELVTLVGGG